MALRTVCYRILLYVLTIELPTIPRKCYIDNGRISCMDYTLFSVSYAQRSFEIHFWPFVLAADSFIRHEKSILNLFRSSYAVFSSQSYRRIRKDA